MATDERFRQQVDLLIRVLPSVAEENVFALKGGTAINLFVRDLPRLSVDIDLTYLARDLIMVNTREVTPPVTFRIVRSDATVRPDRCSSAIAAINVWISRENSTSSSQSGR